MQSLWTEYSSESVIFVAVHESWGESDTQVKQWISYHGITFPVIHEDSLNAIGKLYGVTGVPLVYIIDQDMEIARIFGGPTDCDEIKSALPEPSGEYEVPIFKNFGRYSFGPIDVPRWMKVAYLWVNDLKAILDSVEARPSRKFNNMVKGYLEAYLRKGKMPPKEIASAILNLADEYASGKVMTLRAGDYLALQNYMRKRSR